jgi:hypothetical protein
MSDHEQTLRAMADEEQSKLDSLPTAKGKGEPTSEAADRFRARRAACLAGFDALVRLAALSSAPPDLVRDVAVFVGRCRDIRHGSPNAFYAHVDKFCKAWPTCPDCGGMGTTTHDILVGGTEHDTEERDCQTCGTTGIAPPASPVVAPAPPETFTEADRGNEHPWVKRGPYPGLEHTGMPFPVAPAPQQAWADFLVEWVDYNLGKGHTDRAWQEFQATGGGR